MSIELHCPQCQKLIRAPDDAGGKNGKCPYCKAPVYIPLPKSNDDEEIGLAPLDPDEEKRERELRRESIRYVSAVQHATDAGIDTGASSSSESADVVDMSDEVETFVRAMHKSELEQADSAAARLRHAGTRARDYVQGLLMDEIPPEFEGIPQPLVQGFLKALLSRLS